VASRGRHQRRLAVVGGIIAIADQGRVTMDWVPSLRPKLLRSFTASTPTPPNMPPISTILPAAAACCTNTADSVVPSDGGVAALRWSRCRQPGLRHAHGLGTPKAASLVGTLAGANVSTSSVAKTTVAAAKLVKTTKAAAAIEFEKLPRYFGIEVAQGSALMPLEQPKRTLKLRLSPVRRQRRRSCRPSPALPVRSPWGGPHLPSKNKRHHWRQIRKPRWSRRFLPMHPLRRPLWWRVLRRSMRGFRDYRTSSGASRALR